MKIWKETLKTWGQKYKERTQPADSKSQPASPQLKPTKFPFDDSLDYDSRFSLEPELLGAYGSPPVQGKGSLNW